MQALKRGLLVVCCMCTGLVAILLAGCAPAADGSTRSAPAVIIAQVIPGHSPIIIDAGIIFADQANYLCMPLERLGISESEDVLAIHTSCECAQPTIIQFHNTQSKLGRALRIDFAPELISTPAHSGPLNLAVEISMRIAGGRAETTKIHLLATTQVVQFAEEETSLNSCHEDRHEFAAHPLRGNLK